MGGRPPRFLHGGEDAVRRRSPPRRHQIGHVGLDRGVLDPRRRTPQHQPGEHRPQIRREDQWRHGRHHERDREEHPAAVAVEQAARGQRRDRLDSHRPGIDQRHCRQRHQPTTAATTCRTSASQRSSRSVARPSSRTRRMRRERMWTSTTRGMAVAMNRPSGCLRTVRCCGSGPTWHVAARRRRSATSRAGSADPPTLALQFGNRLLQG